MLDKASVLAERKAALKHGAATTMFHHTRLRRSFDDVSESYLLE